MARNRVWLAWFVAAVMLALGGVARGQFTQHAGPMGQIVPARSVPEDATLLGLSDAQRDTLRALYEAYRLEYQRAKRDGEKAYQSAWNEMMEGDATEADANRAVLDFTRRVERAERAFFDDLRAILTPEQGTRFPKVERARRRDLGLRFAFASGRMSIARAVQGSFGGARGAPWARCWTAGRKTSTGRFGHAKRR